MAQELLKEAIADAKAVREVALQNAKMALEEAFDSKIKNMLSAKLAEELEEDVELEELYEDEDEENVGEAYNKDEDDAMKEDFDLDEDLDEEINLDELMAELEMSEANEDEDEETNEGIKDILGKAGKAVVKLGNRDAVKFIKDVKAKGMYDDFKKAVEDGNAQNKPEFKALFGSGMSNSEKMAAISIAAELEFGKKIGGKSSGVAFEESTNEDFDIDALIAEIEAELEEGKAEKENNEELEEARRKAKRAEKELEEALSTVSSLRESISEMNLLNSKLLYCNKLFRANSLNESQKIKVVDALDKASTAGEAKLVYETLQESFAFTGVEKRTIKEGLARASKPAGVAPKKVITESVDETVSRFQKLANIQL